MITFEDGYFEVLKEHSCLETGGESVDVSGNGADVVRVNDREVVVTMPNGGYVRLWSTHPIKAKCKPE